jgi:hypothetical protein
MAQILLSDIKISNANQCCNANTKTRERTNLFKYFGSPYEIRTHVNGLRTRHPGPLDEGTALIKWLGYQDSNLDCLIQSQVCCRCTIPQKAQSEALRPDMTRENYIGFLPVVNPFRQNSQGNIFVPNCRNSSSNAGYNRL